MKHACSSCTCRREWFVFIIILSHGMICIINICTVSDDNMRKVNNGPEPAEEKINGESGKPAVAFNELITI